MNAVSRDILLSILGEFRSSSSSKEDLFNCLLVCKVWNQLASSLLYGHIALVNHAVGAFSRSYQPRLYGEHVRSVTLKFERDNAVADVNQELQHVALILPTMTNLASLSLHVRVDRASHEVLTSLLKAMPLSCTGLELDTYHSSWGLESQTVHLCDSVRAVLPRMFHVRIRTESMCAAMFGTGVLPHEAPQDIGGSHPRGPFVPIHLPHMRSLVAVCARQMLVARCGAPSVHESNLWAAPSAAAWSSVTAALESLVEAPGAIPRDGANVSAVACTDHDQDDMATWKAIIRADVVARTSWAVPFRIVWHEAVIPGSRVVRLPDGRELMTTLGNIEKLAEGEEWVDVSGGGRLPRLVMEAASDGRPSFAAGCRIEPMSLLKTAAQWRQDNPKKMTHVWMNENITGEKILEAEKRTGKDEYLSLEPVVESTPEGWVRGYRNESLERAGD